MKEGDLSVADLRDWFGRSYHTVRMWVYGSEPRLSPSEALSRLERLEKAVKRGAFKELHLAGNARRTPLIRRIFNDQRDASVPQRHPAGRGSKGSRVV